MVNETFTERFMSPLQGMLLTVKDETSQALCSIGYNIIFFWIVLPILLIVFMFVIIRYKDIITDWIFLHLAKRGYIWVDIILPNKHIKTKRIKLDEFRKFTLGVKSYVLDDLDEFIIGYKKAMPVFLYDDKFILPLKLKDIDITEKCSKALGIKKGDMNKGDNPNKIRALELKIDTHILNKVYSKKLLSDLYSISMGELDFKKLMFWGVIGVIAFIIAYYTGIIDGIVSFLDNMVQTNG